jgi:hypothetical protein
MEKAQDEMGYGKPKKPQLFKELWNVKQTRGLCYFQDVLHAIGNSDQYPFDLWKKDYMHLAAQEAQTETINAVAAALDRVPKYEDRLDPDSISRHALMKYILEKIIRYGEAYGVEDVLRDIGEFQIRRKEIENADRQGRDNPSEQRQASFTEGRIADQGSDPRGRSESDLGCDVSVLQRDARGQSVSDRGL